MENPWKLVKRNLIYQNKFGYKLYDDDVLTPAGGQGKYTVLESAGSVVIVAITSDKKLILISQWRYPVGKEFLELPAGSITEGEDPLLTAKRELLEETGASSNSWTKLSSYWIGNGILNISESIYLAQDISFESDSQEDTEKISVQLINFNDAIKMVENGDFDEQRTIMGLFLADKFLSKNNYPT